MNYIQEVLKKYGVVEDCSGPYHRVIEEARQHSMRINELLKECFDVKKTSSVYTTIEMELLRNQTRKDPTRRYGDKGAVERIGV